MGNAPLPRPPAPTERRVVIPITTSSRHWFAGTELVIFPPISLPVAPEIEDSTITLSTTTGGTENEAASSRRGNDESVLTTRIPQEEAIQEEETDESVVPIQEEQKEVEEEEGVTTEEEETPENDNHPTVFDYPPQFRRRRRQDGDVESLVPTWYVIPPDEYQQKLKLVQDDLLSQWKGGKIGWGIGMGSCLVVITFFVAWMTPGFANSSFVRDHPFYVCATGIGLLLGYVVAFRFANQSTRHLLENVEEAFWPWKRNYGVRVQMQKVSHWNLPKKQTGNNNNNNNNNGKSTSSNTTVAASNAKMNETRTTNCFCLVMIHVEDDNNNNSSSNTLGREQIGMDHHNNDNDDQISLGTVHTDGSDE